MADFDWKRFDVSHWWKVLSAAGIAMLVAAIAAKYPPAIFLGLGVLFLGVGDWHQHPEVTMPAQSYGLPPGTVTTRERNITFIGLALDAIGLVLFLTGLFKLLQAELIDGRLGGARDDWRYF
jgi:hypothetical protein